MPNKSTYTIRIGKELVPVSKKLYLYFYRSKRRMKYYEHDIKIEAAVRDSDGEIIAFKPSKEDSMERIVEKGVDFDTSESIEDLVIDNLMAEKLRKCVDKLPDDDQRLIHAIYYNDKSERQAARELGIPQQTLHNKKVRILDTLHELLEK